MASRLALQLKLEELLGSRNVYYQPPATVKMNYPAIVYSRDIIKSTHANNEVYNTQIAYEIMVIDRDPDSIIIGKVATLPGCKFTRNYTVDNLNHDAFTLYF